MEKHLTLVAALNIGFGALGVLIATVVFIAVAGGGMLSGDPEAITITLLVATAISAFIFIVSLPEIIGGIGLLMRKRWARILVLIIACINLLEVPFGTLVGIYSIWVLINEETVKLFAGPDRPAPRVRK